ncbi:sodium:solute symporter [Glaciecola sp. 33A]|jgi:Na+/proline symporter|uniref:sodium:solute symporter family transporter n=1 Tax=Glaciecola sp. 33A TaxID=2057807 RepID=UPI000C336ABF|nr:sodium:solute symporter [Glaciecola sp. 33A]PKI01468.1 sodium:solute symporter [Glaciecola sp. 33A]
MQNTISSNHAILFLSLFALSFAILGLWLSRAQPKNLETFIVARNTQSSHATWLTLVATTMGTWVLFGPAESAVWGGIGAILGYALGVLIPSLVLIPLGIRIRKIMPNGHTLTEFVYARYGKTMYVFVVSIMVFYLFIGLTAGMTGIAQLVNLVSSVPLWITASIVMLCTLTYTLYGGLNVSILTDRLQMIFILPFIALIIILAWQGIGGMEPVISGLKENAPHLINPFDSQGIKTGVTFFLAVALTGLFYQGTWQRIFAAKNDRVVRNGFIISALVSFPIIFCLGLFGLAFVGLSLPGEISTALFSVLLGNASYWFLVAMIFFGLALVMSSADSTISALNSMFIVDLKHALPNISNHKLMRISLGLIVFISLIALLVASQGYSILYLFLLADLLCCAAAFPVFIGFYNANYKNYQAILSLVSGLVAGAYYFPAPGEAADYLFESFLWASLTPVIVSLVLMLLPSRTAFNFSQIKNKVLSFR